jgi:hypothetical protein
LLLGQALGLVQPALDPWFASITPPSEEEFFFTPLAEGYSILTSLVGVFGVAFLARGLSDARRHRDSGRVRQLATVLTVLAAASLALNLLGLTYIEFEPSPMLALSIAGTLLVRLLMTLAVAYLVVIAVVGWIEHESPRLGWGFAAIGAGLIVLQRLLASVIGVVPLSQDLLLAVVGRVGEAALLGWVLLVVAFALGLPSTDGLTDDPEVPPTADPPGATRSGSGAG